MARDACAPSPAADACACVIQIRTMRLARPTTRCQHEPNRVTRVTQRGIAPRRVARRPGHERIWLFTRFRLRRPVQLSVGGLTGGPRNGFPSLALHVACHTNSGTRHPNWPFALPPIRRGSREIPAVHRQEPAVHENFRQVRASACSRATGAEIASLFSEAAAHYLISRSRAVRQGRGRC
jgi:hypothetical protein